MKRYGQFWTPAEYVTAALALDAQDGQSGSITCLRGSHRLPVLPHEASGVLGASLALTPSSLDLSQFQEVSLKVIRCNCLLQWVYMSSGPADLSCGCLSTTKLLDGSYEIVTRCCTASAAPAWRRVISPHQSDSSYRPQFHRILSPQSWLWLPVATRTSNCRAASSLCCRRDQQIPKSNGRC